MKKNKAQITIFVIMALVILAVSLIFIALPRLKIEPTIPKVENPQEFIEKCINDNGKKAAEILIANGGYLNASLYVLYENKKVPYLCYNKNYYTPCLPQNPLLIQYLEKEITRYIAPKLNSCFETVASGAESRGQDVNIGDMSIETTVSNKIKINVKRKLIISKSETTLSFDSFSSQFSSPLYSLASVASEIVSQEAKFCNFEYLGYMILYPDFLITKENVGGAGSQSTIYIVKDKKTSKAFSLAIKGCSLPPGL